MEGGKRGQGTARGGHSELPGTLSSVSPVRPCGGHIWKFGSLGPTGGRGKQRAGPSRGGETWLPELALWPALCTAGAASHMLGAGTRQAASVSPQSRTGFPHKTPQHNLLLLILQMLSQHPLSARLQGRLAFPRTQPLRIPRAHCTPTDHRPPAPAPSNERGPKDLEDPTVPGPEHLCPPSTDAHTERQKEPSRAPSPRPCPRRGPAGGQRSAFCKFASPEAEPSLPYILAGRVPPGRPRRLQPAPGGAGLSFTAGVADGGGRRRPGRGGSRSWSRSESGGRTREGRGREPHAHSAAPAERGRPRLGFLGSAAPRGAEAMLMTVPSRGLGHCRAAPPKLRPAPPRPPAIPTPRETQIPRSTFPRLSPPGAGWRIFQRQRPAGEVTHPAPVGMLRPTAEISHNPRAPRVSRGAGSCRCSPSPKFIQNALADPGAPGRGIGA